MDIYRFYYFDVCSKFKYLFKMKILIIPLKSKFFVLGSPVADRVQIFEKAMKESAGLKTKDPLRRSLVRFQLF